MKTSDGKKPTIDRINKRKEQQLSTARDNKEKDKRTITR
jgi:hypothetical protein